MFWIGSCWYIHRKEKEFRARLHAQDIFLLNIAKAFQKVSHKSTYNLNKIGTL